MKLWILLFLGILWTTGCATKQTRIGGFLPTYPVHEASNDPNAQCPRPGDIWETDHAGQLSELRYRPEQLPDEWTPGRILFPALSVSDIGSQAAGLQFTSTAGQTAQLTASWKKASVRKISVDAPNAVARALKRVPQPPNPGYLDALKDVRRGQRGLVLVTRTVEADSLSYDIEFNDSRQFNAEANVLAGYLIGAKAENAGQSEQQVRWPVGTSRQSSNSTWVIFVATASGQREMRNLPSQSIEFYRVQQKQSAEIEYEERLIKYNDEKKRIEQANQLAMREYEAAKAKWRQAVNDEEVLFARAQANYQRELGERRILGAHRTRSDRGSDSDPNNRPYNFRLDVPKGTRLTFEVEPNATVSMKRDRPHGEDPDIFTDIRNGSSRTTNWDPGCENCNFYFKQDDVDRTTITIWRDAKPVPPVKRDYFEPAPPTPQQLPPEPVRPTAGR